MACPDDSELAAMVEHSLDPAAFAALELHIDTCDHCRKVLAAMIAQSTLAVGTPAEHDEVDAIAKVVDVSIDGRYVIEATLGRGGMGTVYLAHDRTLDREVALKLHRAGLGPDGDGQGSVPKFGSARLHREALAMAKLAHPNVVTVYEVGTFEDRLYVAMEYVRGETLRGWLAAAPRPWRQIVALLLETGNGLAAAHAAGLVHRDFKPENVLVGDDGRPRVGDFGLARVGASNSGTRPRREAAVTPVGPTELATPRSGPPHGGDRPALATPMTETGALLGTPAYMAPEQIAGDVVDARSDQFAFCVVAWECLYGKRPFTGATLAALDDAIRARDLQRPSKSDVPARVRAVLERGLATEPSARYADMPALLAALRKAAMPRTKKRIAVAVVVAGAVAGVAFAGNAHVRELQHEAACAAAEAEMTAVFDPFARAGIRVAFVATGAPGSVATYARTEKVLARYADALAAQAGAVCRGLDEPRIVTTLREDCLAERRRTFAEYVQLLHDADPTLVARSTSAAWSMFEAMPCNDTQTLLSRARTAARTPPEVAASLRRVKTLGDLGRFAEAIALGEPLVEKARERGDENAELIALLELGQQYANLEEIAKTSATFERAIALAEKLGRDLDAAIGHAALASLYGIVTNEYAAAHRSIGLARAKLERLGGDNPALRADLLMIEAQIFADENRLGEAEKAMRVAAEMIEQAYGSEHPKFGAAYGTLSQILRYQNKADEALTMAQRALEALRRSHGDDHPFVAGAEMTLGQNLADAGRLDEAREHYERADALFARVFGDNHPARIALAANVGALHMKLKDYAAAEAQFRRALAMVERLHGPIHMDACGARADVARALAAAGRLREALAEQEIVVRTYEKLGADGEPRLIGGLLDLGIYQLDTGAPDRAAAAAERALGIIAKRPSDANPAELGEGKFLLARALWASKHDRERALRLAEEAKGTPLPPKLQAAVEAWLSERGRSSDR